MIYHYIAQISAATSNIVLSLINRSNANVIVYNISIESTTDFIIHFDIFNQTHLLILLLTNYVRICLMNEILIN